MTIARLALASLLLVTACKDKAQSKPAPVETKPAEPPKPEAPKPTEAAPPPAEPEKPAETKPAGGLNTQADYEKRATDLTDQLLDVFAKNTSCDKLATALDQFMDKNKDSIAGAKAFEAANPDAEKTMAGKMQERQKQVAIKVGPIMKKCEKHEGLRAAMTRLSAK